MLQDTRTVPARARLATCSRFHIQCNAVPLLHVTIQCGGLLVSSGGGRASGCALADSLIDVFGAIDVVVVD